MVITNIKVYTGDVSIFFAVYYIKYISSSSTTGRANRYSTHTRMGKKCRFMLKRAMGADVHIHMFLYTVSSN